MVVSSRAWRRSIAGWLMLCPLLSCQRQGGPFVNLLLTNFSPEAATVSLTVTAQGESRELQFSGNDSLNIITYEFPIGFRGDTRFEARASLSPDCVVGIGSSELQIDEDRAYDLKLPLTTDAASRCVPYGVRLTVIKAGTAQSVVSSSPPAVHCDETCSQQTVAFRAGEQVKLSSVVTGDDLFAGWSGGCTGTLTDCSFTITADTTVTATTNKCQGFCPMPATGTTADLYAVWGISPSAVYAVGTGGTILKWNGTAWSTVPSGVTTTLRAVTAPRDNTSLILAGGDNGLLLAWTGSGWVRFNPAPPVFQINAVGANKFASSLYIAGSGGTYLVWDGNSKWNVPAGYSNSKQLTGISFMPGTDEHYLSGAAGLMVRYDPAGIGFKYPGQTSNSSANLNAVWAATQAIYMVGEGGTIVRRRAGSGQDGAVGTSGTSANLRAVSGANDQTIFAVGDGGTALLGNGTSWTKLPTITNQTLYGVYAVESSTVIAVGAAGTALRYKP